jgi:hypothetical protein
MLEMEGFGPLVTALARQDTILRCLTSSVQCCLCAPTAPSPCQFPQQLPDRFFSLYRERWSIEGRIASTAIQLTAPGFNWHESATTGENREA